MKIICILLLSQLSCACIRGSIEYCNWWNTHWFINCSLLYVPLEIISLISKNPPLPMKGCKMLDYAVTIGLVFWHSICRITIFRCITTWKWYWWRIVTPRDLNSVIWAWTYLHFDFCYMQIAEKHVDGWIWQVDTTIRQIDLRICDRST